MRVSWKLCLIAGAAGIMCFSAGTLFAAGEKTESHAPGSIEILPAQYTFVYGDGDKFQAHNWTKTGYVGGAEEFKQHYETPEDVTIDIEGRGLLDEDPSITRNDYFGSLLVKKDDFGFVQVEFKEFPKFYDTLGGVYHRFTALEHSSIDRELELDIGTFIVEAGLTVEGWPEVEFEYEREFKDGAKSRLTWASAVEGGVTRKIIPSWQEIHETVHAFTIKAKHDVKQYTVKGEQHWELIKSENRRYERSLGTVPAFRIQTQNPEAAFMSSIVGVERWYKKEKAFSSLYYRYARVKNSEQENLREYDENLNPRSFSAYAENKFNARADNRLDTHTAVFNLMGTPWPWLALNAKIKEELVRIRGNSSYPSDLRPAGGAAPTAAAPTTPNGIIDETTFSDNKNRTFRSGQSVSVRFRGIPRTALYTEVDIEETKNWLSEHRWSIAGERPAGTDFFDRRTVTDMIRGAGTFGADVSPVRYLNTTAQFRYRFDNVTYDDKFETSPPTTTAKSAFFDEMDTRTVEFNTRTTLRVVRWLQPSFRYIVRDINYMTRTEGEAQMKSGVLLNDYVYDLTWIPSPSLIITGAFARESLSTKTAANSFTGSSIPLPGFDAGVNTWLFSMSYIPRENLSVTSSLSQSRADNFNDYANIGIPLGADFNRVTAIFGLKWTPRKDISIEPEYAYYHYGANPHADAGSYDAHLLGLEVSMGWG